jgi:DNA-binding transcriptional LysR family regulator
MRQLILRGIGAGFLPGPLVAEDVAAGRLITLPVVDAYGLARELALVRHARADALPSAVESFVETVREEIARRQTEQWPPHPTSPPPSEGEEFL